MKNNPNLIKYVKSNEMTWQKFYEMYDLYGEDNNIWKDYIDKKEENTSNTSSNIAASGISGITISEVINWLKNVDLDGLQEGIGNVQRVLGLVQDFSKKDSKESETKAYKPRPLYKHFED